jgi:diguanylate cyclase (GGDEF)-like protein
MQSIKFRPVLAALLIAWTSIVAYALYSLITESVSDEERNFIEYAESVADELNHKLDTNEAVLAGFSAFLQVVDRSDVDATTRYAALTTAAFPHIYMLEVARKVSRAEQHLFEYALQKEWRPDFALKDFSSITRRPANGAPTSSFTWPILFMYPALPEAREIYGLRLETVDYLAHSLALAHGSAKPVASPVFNLYEGGNAYILLQETVRSPERRSGTDLNFFGNTMVAMLIIKGQSLVPAGLYSTDHKFTDIAAHLDAPTGLGKPLFAHTASEAPLLDKLLLPSFKYRLTSRNSSQPITLQFERQLRLSVFLTPNFLAQMLLLIAAIIVAPWLTLRHNRTLKQLELEYRRTAYLATHDQLTNLPNRFLFSDRFTQAFHGWKRNGNAFAVLIIDLDHFKEINDKHGHEIGDQVLVTAAKRMIEELRSCDTVARYGGDEFAVLLVSVLNAEEASMVGEKLRDVLSKPISTPAGEMKVTSSIGIAICPTHGETLDELCRDADEAMYRTKKSGRNGVSVFSAENSRV